MQQCIMKNISELLERDINSCILLSMDWSEENNALSKRWSFSDYATTFSFATKIALLSEKLNHHPDVKFGWGYVEVTLTTHDADNSITEKDRSMAEEIDKL